MKYSMLALIIAGVSVLSGCTTEDQRLAKCEAKGISRDVCYQEEKAYWRNYQANMATLNASSQQADAIREGNEINRKQYKHVNQHAQAAKKEHVYKAEGLQLVLKADGNVTVDGKLAALDETTPKAKTYSQGLYQFIVYSNGKIALLGDGKFITYMKKEK